MSQIAMDLPFVLPIADRTIPLPPDAQCHLLTKRKGQELFTVEPQIFEDTFSGILVDGPPVDLITPTKPGQRQSEALLRRALEFLSGPAAELTGRDMSELCYMDGYPYSIDYVDKASYIDGASRADKTRLVPKFAAHTACLAKKVGSYDRNERAQLTDAMLDEYTKCAQELNQVGSAYADSIGARGFVLGVMRAVHDFALTARQHANAFETLCEEHLRDLCLILIKCLFPGSQGEPYNYNGKADIIVHNRGRYDPGLIEFKIWRGQQSFYDVFSQATNEHATGDESFVSIVMVNKNADVNAVYARLLALVSAQGIVTDCGGPNPFAGEGSSLRLFSAKVKLRSATVPLYLVLMDVHYENIRGTPRKGGSRP